MNTSTYLEPQPDLGDWPTAILPEQETKKPLTRGQREVLDHLEKGRKRHAELEAKKWHKAPTNPAPYWEQVRDALNELQPGAMGAEALAVLQN